MIPFTNDNTRACGRTYRRVLFAALNASEGKKVIFAVGSARENARIVERLKIVTKGYAVHSGHGLFEFPNEGAILVRHMEGCFSGMRVDVAVTDELEGANWRQIEKYQQNINRVIK